MEPVSDIDDFVLSGLFEAGGWSETADDNHGNERLPRDFVAHLVHSYAAQEAAHSQGALIGMGVLVLALSVAEWGVDWSGSGPSDPAQSNWKGPSDISQGKHLMSYALGGIGVAHLDVVHAARFFKAFVELVPDAHPDLQQIGALSPNFHYDSLRARGGTCASNPKQAVIMRDLNGDAFHHGYAVWGGDKYCSRFNPNGQLDSRAWQVFRHWSRIALRRRDMQAWIVRYWLNEFWVPAYNEVFHGPHASIEQALVVARMWNSSAGDALNAIKAAGSEADPAKRVDAMLERYGRGSQTKQGRIRLMRRPAVVYAALRTG